MESKIKWQTGVPEKSGNYLITTSYNEVLVSSYKYDYRDDCWYWFDSYGYLLKVEIKIM